MKYKLPPDLIIIDLLSALLIVVIAFLPVVPLRVVLGLPFLLFFPGYVFMAALYPRPNSIDGIERLALSLGFSIALTGLLGLGLNFTPWGIHLFSVSGSLAGIIVAMSVIAFFRRSHIPERDSLPFKIRISFTNWKKLTLPNRILTAALVLLIAGAIGTLVYVVTAPKEGETYTEFYILGANGQVADYPRQLQLGQEGSVTVGVINRENVPATYQLVVTLDGVVKKAVGSLALEPDEKWEDTVVFSPDKVGESQEMSFRLYDLARSDTGEYRELHFWVNVK